MKYKKFEIPDSFYEKLVEFSGSNHSVNGFILGIVNQEGEVDFRRYGVPVILAGLQKEMELWFKELDTPQQTAIITQQNPEEDDEDL